MPHVPVPDPDAMLASAVCDTFWVPDDVTVVDRTDLCMLSCPRDIRGLNSVHRSCGPAPHMADLVEEVRAAHAGRHSRWMVGPLDGGAPLEAALEAAGYRPGHQHYGYTSSADRTASAPERSLVTRRVTDMAGMRAWYQVSAEAFGEARHTSDAELELFLAQCTGVAARVVRFVAWERLSGRPISAGAMTMFPDLQFGLLWAGGTVPDARGRGGYTAVLDARFAVAVRAGLRRVGLYARADTSAPIVDAFGFERHGGMRFWERGP